MGESSIPKKSLVLAALVPAALLAGCSASYPGVEPSAFASVACATWLAKGSAETLSDSSTISGLSGTGDEQRNQAIALAEKVVAEWEKSRDKIAAAKHAVKDGAKIAALFTDHCNTRIDAANELIDEFRSDMPRTAVVPESDGERRIDHSIGELAPHFFRKL